MKLLSNIARISAVIAFCAGTYVPSAQSETIRIPLGQQGDHWQVSRPTTGMNKAQVIDTFGEPLDRSGPVGDPAIYTWHYEQFKVYFEDDSVIHTVVKHSAN